jgi:putative heme-binding domain-containing protein
MPAVQVTTDETWKMVGFVKRIGSQGLFEKAVGNPRTGKAIYEKSQCAACHRIDSEGQDLGPDLTTIGRRRGLSFLEESILKPDAYISNNYRAIRIVMKSGATVVGIRLNEDDLSVQVRDTAGNPRSFMKEDVKEIRYNQPSLMSSYQSVLSRQELSDLIAYLNSLKGAQ